VLGFSGYSGEPFHKEHAAKRWQLRAPGRGRDERPATGPLPLQPPGSAYQQDAAAKRKDHLVKKAWSACTTPRAIGGRPPINPWSPQQRTSPGKGPGENGVRHLRDKAQCERHESYPPDRLDRYPPNANNDPVGNLNEQPQTPGAYACPFNSPSCYFETECSMYQCMAGNYYIDSCGSQKSN